MPRATEDHSRVIRRIARAADRITWRRLRVGTFERHLARSRPALDRLRAGGHTNENVLAVLMVESFYRHRAERLAEYAFWALATLAGRPPVGLLSVGLAQMQLGHWQELGLIEDTRFSLRSLRTVRDLEANYRVCSLYLAGKRMLDHAEDAALARAYSGAAATRYATLLALFRRTLPATG